MDLLILSNVLLEVDQVNNLLLEVDQVTVIVGSFAFSSKVVTHAPLPRLPLILFVTFPRFQATFPPK